MRGRVGVAVTFVRPELLSLSEELNRQGLDEDRGATASLRWVAWSSLVVIGLVTAVSIAFADTMWMALPGFVWLSTGILTMTSGASAALLWQEARGQKSRALSSLAAAFGYLTVVYPAFFMSFPGAITPAGPWLGGSQSSAWLYFAAHIGIVLGIGISSFFRIRDRDERWWDVPSGILAGLVVSAWVIDQHQTLPVLLERGVPNRLYDGMSVLAVALGVVAGGVVVLSAVRTQSRLRWWLLVVVSLATTDVLIHMFSTARWQVAWYMPRLIGVLAGALLMVVLFAEVAAQSRSMTALRVRERLLTAEKFKEAAETDPLTGCLNRRGLEARFSAPGHSADSAGRGFPAAGYSAVYFVDLDNFKNINDEYSHDIGDTALRVVAQALRRSVRDGDVVVRYGGDEFLVVAQGLSAPGDADRIARDLVRAIGQAPTESLPAGLVVTASVGYVVVTEISGNLGSVIHDADLSMQQAKKEGKNRHRRGDVGVSNPVVISSLADADPLR